MTHVHAPLASALPLDLLAFATLGLLGSAAHCVGMCAPFALLVRRHYARAGGAHGALASHGWYTAGRLITYALLGALGGAAGTALQTAGAFVGMQRTAALVGGLALVGSAGASLLAFAPARHARGVARLTSWLAPRLPRHPLTFGLVLGLLPCGLLYAATLAAVARADARSGAAALAMFGLGTVPALFGVSLLDTALLQRRAWLDRGAQVFVLGLGVWYLWRGVTPLPGP